MSSERPNRSKRARSQLPTTPPVALPTIVPGMPDLDTVSPLERKMWRWVIDNYTSLRPAVQTFYVTMLSGGLYPLDQMHLRLMQAGFTLEDYAYCISNILIQTHTKFLVQPQATVGGTSSAIIDGVRIGLPEHLTHSYETDMDDVDQEFNNDMPLDKGWFCGCPADPMDEVGEQILVECLRAGLYGWAPGLLIQQEMARDNNCAWLNFDHRDAVLQISDGELRNWVEHQFNAYEDPEIPHLCVALDLHTERMLDKVMGVPYLREQVQRMGTTASTRKPVYLHVPPNMKGYNFKIGNSLKAVTVALATLLLPKGVNAQLAIRGRKIRGMKDYLDVAGTATPPEGRYLVIFNDDIMIRRYRIGNNTMCGDEQCSGKLWPNLCPSPDRNTRCPDKPCTDCETKCGGKVQDGECVWAGWDTDVPGAAVAIAPPFPGAVVGAHDAYVRGMDQYNDTEVVPHPRIGHNSTHRNRPKLNAEELHWLCLISAVFAVIALVFVVKMVVRIIREIKIIKNTPAVIDLDEEDGKEGEVPRSTVVKVQNHEWASLILSVILVVLTFALVVKADDFDMETFEQYQEREAFFNYTLPSACSCDNPGEVISQLRCVVGCQDSFNVGEKRLTMHFDLDQQCRPKYLLLLTSLEEQVCHQCDGGAKTCSNTMIGNNFTHIYPKVSHGGARCDCLFGGYSQSLIRWSYDLYDAEYCDVGRNQHEYISGLEDNTAYTASIDSTLLAQSSYLKVWVGGTVQNYKLTNGELGSTRAFIIDKDDIAQDGSLKQGTYARTQIISRNTVNVGYCMSNEVITHGLPEFRPAVFDQKCDVDVTFKTLRCFTVPKSCRGEYREFENITMFRAFQPGMCNGKYVTNANFGTAPAGLKKCAGCVMDEQCNSSVVPPHGACSYTFQYETIGNTTKLVNNTAATVVQNAMPWVASILSVVMVVLIAIAAVLIIRFVVSHAGYKRV